MERDYQEYWQDLTGSHAFHPGNQFRYRLIVRELQRLNLRPKDILDCGCGDGSLIHELRKSFPESAFYGTDIADNVPSNNPHSGIHFFKADLGKPISDDLRRRFDFVVCSEVIEHVSDDSQLLENLVALAKPNAKIILTTQSGTIYRTEQYLGHLRHYNLPALCDRFRQTGVRIIRAYHSGWPFLNAQKIVAHRLFSSVQEMIIKPAEPSAVVRFAMSGLTPLYMMSSRSRGPQLMIVAAVSE